jgi:hypothetical protein
MNDSFHYDVLTVRVINYDEVLRKFYLLLNWVGGRRISRRLGRHLGLRQPWLKEARSNSSKASDTQGQ